jgi:hypothetical protein
MFTYNSNINNNATILKQKLPKGIILSSGRTQIEANEARKENNFNK